MAIAEAVGLGAAVDYLEALGMENVFAHDRELAAYALERLAEMPDVRVLGLELNYEMGMPGIGRTRRAEGWPGPGIAFTPRSVAR